MEHIKKFQKGLISLQKAVWLELRGIKGFNDTKYFALMEELERVLYPSVYLRASRIAFRAYRNRWRRLYKDNYGWNDRTKGIPKKDRKM